MSILAAPTSLIFHHHPFKKMATYAPERLDTRERSSSDVRRPAADWSPLLRVGGDTPAYESLRRSRSKRENGHARSPFYGNGTYRSFEEHQRWEAEYSQANALQTRQNLAPRAQSEESRRSRSRKDRGGRVLTPERPTRFDHRPSSDPQTPRFEEMADDFEDLETRDSVVSEASSDADQYEAPPTLLGQAQDCVGVLAQAVDRARALGDFSGQPDFASRCEDSLFRLRVWMSEVNIESMPIKGDNELDGEAITLTSSILYRLHARVCSLARSMSSAEKDSSKTFSFAEPLQKDVDNDDSDSEHSGLPSERLTPAKRVEQSLTQVELQIRTLRRLTRSLRIVQKDDFSIVVVKHVAEVTRLFGDSEGCETWKEEVQGMPADAALKRVQEIVRSGIGV